VLCVEVGPVQEGQGSKEEEKEEAGREGSGDLRLSWSL
jgi:hypothetical protein